MKFKKIKATNMQQVIYKELEVAIASGELKPGTRLTLEDIASQFEVSIMPVREAFRALEAINLVKKDKSRNITVSELTIEDVHEIIGIRLLLEPYAAIEALRGDDGSLPVVLQEIHLQLQTAKTEEEYLKYNRNFHFALYRKSQQEILFRLIESLWARYNPYLYMFHKSEKHWPNQTVVDTHQDILDSVKNKDEENLKKCLRKDLEVSANSIIEMMKENAKCAQKF